MKAEEYLERAWVSMTPSARMRAKARMASQARLRKRAWEAAPVPPAPPPAPPVARQPLGADPRLAAIEGLRRLVREAYASRTNREGEHDLALETIEREVARAISRLRDSLQP